MNESFRINYYVAGMLAQGGNLSIGESKLVFSPTSAIDRAMGAKDVEIPFKLIRGVTIPGNIARSFNILTDERVHRFEGSQAKLIWETLEKVLPKQNVPKPAPATPAPRPQGLKCEQCSQALEASFTYCPHCGSRIKTTCVSCEHSIDPTWNTCAFCGRKLQLSKAA